MNHAVIFDFDDTIVSTKHNHITSFIQAGKKYELTIRKNDIKKFYGLPTVNYHTLKLRGVFLLP